MAGTPDHNLILELIRLVKILLNRSDDSKERRLLRQAMKQLDCCVIYRPQLVLDDTLREEVEAQINWLPWYFDQQNKSARSIAPGSDDLLLRRYAEETLLGAKSIAGLLGISEPSDNWCTVKHKQRGCSGVTERCVNSENEIVPPQATGEAGDEADESYIELYSAKNMPWYF